MPAHVQIGTGTDPTAALLDVAVEVDADADADAGGILRATDSLSLTSELLLSADASVLRHHASLLNHTSTHDKGCLGKVKRVLGVAVLLYSASTSGIQLI